MSEATNEGRREESRLYGDGKLEEGDAKNRVSTAGDGKLDTGDVKNRVSTAGDGSEKSDSGGREWIGIHSMNF